jgi:NAD(P)-dependent dehydrogenase (short-subunit alcohol dehydrogenase family)
MTRRDDGASTVAAMDTLRDKTAVVVGGHSGFGEAISRLLAAEGAAVVIGARRRELVESVASSIGGVGVVCDITDDEQLRHLVVATQAAHGDIHIAVNCAGFEQSTPLVDLTPDKVEAMLAVQLAGALSCMRHFGEAIAAHGAGGSFVSLSSLTAHNPARGLAAYASAKAGVEYATKIAAVEYGSRRVRFNAVSASLVETPMTARVFQRPAAIAALVEMTPLGRMGTVGDIAAAVRFLCSDEATFVTGQTLCVDGGASLTMLPTAQMYADVARRWNEQHPD